VELEEDEEDEGAISKESFLQGLVLYLVVHSRQATDPLYLTL